MDPALNPTLADMRSRMDPDGQVSRIIEILEKTDGIVEDMPWIECNNGTSHRTTLRRSLTTPQARLFNRGSKPSKSGTATIEEGCIMLEDWAEHDAKLAQLGGNPGAWMMTEHPAHVQGFSHRLSELAFYGNSSARPGEEFMGLAPRYNVLDDAELGDYVINAGGTGASNTSIYLIGWGADTIHGIYPKGMQAGLQYKDLGTKVKDYTDDAGDERKLEVHETYYGWDCGLVVRDYRSVIRIANIDVTALKADPTTGGADLYELLGRAQERTPSNMNAKWCFYANRRVQEYLRLQAQNKKNVQISTEEVTGRRRTSVDGIPLRKSDSIINNEAALVAA